MGDTGGVLPLYIHSRVQRAGSEQLFKCVLVCVHRGEVTLHMCISVCAHSQVRVDGNVRVFIGVHLCV